MCHGARTEQRVGARHARPARRSGRACAWLRSRRVETRRRCPALRAVAFGWCRGEERPDKSTRALAARRRTKSCVLVCQAEERSRPSGGPLAARAIAYEILRLSDAVGGSVFGPCGRVWAAAMASFDANSA